MSKDPIIIDLEDDATELDPAAAPPVDALPAVPVVAVAQGGSRLLAWVLGLGSVLLSALLSYAAWQMIQSLLLSSPILGWGMSIVLALFVAVLGILAVRELLALRRLRKVGDVRDHIKNAIADGPDATRNALKPVTHLYASRDEMRDAINQFNVQSADIVDAPTLVTLAEDQIIAPLDARAKAEVERTARQVATVTAIVPLGLVDLLVATYANLRMIRRVSEIYGGRGGGLASLRLARNVLLHLAATGAIAIGDDLLEPVLGGTVLARMSRRFGEGLINGALTARVGLTAMELSRPLPYSETRKPSLRGTIARALAGVFGNN